MLSDHRCHCRLFLKENLFFQLLPLGVSTAHHLPPSPPFQHPPSSHQPSACPSLHPWIFPIGNILFSWFLYSPRALKLWCNMPYSHPFTLFLCSGAFFLASTLWWMHQRPFTTGVSILAKVTTALHRLLYSSSHFLRLPLHFLIHPPLQLSSLISSSGSLFQPPLLVSTLPSAHPFQICLSTNARLSLLCK